MEPITFQELLNNPAGKSTSYLYSRKNISEELTRKYFELLKTKEFHFNVYLEDNKILYHIKVPSESVSGILYDVCIECQDEISNTKASLLSNNVKIYSNSPSFIFNGYAYVADRREILIDWLKDKLSRASYENPPDIRNPVYVLGFEKSLFFACMFIKENSYYNLENVNLIKSSKANIKKGIDTFNNKFSQYNESKNKDREKKKIKVVKKVIKNNKVVSRKTSMISAKSMKKTSAMRSMKSMKSIRRNKKL